MNIIDCHGSDWKHNDYIESIVEFCIEQLMPRFTTLDIFIQLGQHDSQGGCVAIDKRTFELEIDDEICDDELITCVMHEMVHVWQGATGQVKDKFRGGYKQLWKCKDGKYRNYGNTEYAKQPWEVQAYKMQGPLTKTFMKEYDYE